jgi:hypothetical protein
VGAAYTTRHQLVDDRMMAYLTRGGDEAPQEEPAEGGDVYNAVRAQLAEAAAAAGLDLSRDNSAPAPPALRRPDAILALLGRSRTTHPEGMGAAEIAAALKEDGDASAEPEVLAPTLSRMHNQGRIARPAPGRYAALHHSDHPAG